MINLKKLENDYPVVQCTKDGLFRYEKVNGGINLLSRGFKSKAAAARYRNLLRGIDHPEQYCVD